MRHRPLLLISAMLLLGQVAFAQAGKQIVTISHQYVNDAGCHEEATLEYDNHGRLLHARTLDYDDLGEENVWVTDYDYSGLPNKIVSNTTATTPEYTMTIIVDALLTDNLVTEMTIKQEVGTFYSATDKMTTEYDASGRVVKAHTSNHDSRDDTESVITWEDGNAVQTTEVDIEGTHITNHIYDTSRPSPSNVILAYMLMGMPVDVAGAQAMMGLYDHMGYKPKNLVIGEKHSGRSGSTSERNYVYEYDADGDISSIEVYRDGKLTDTYYLGLTAASVEEVEVDKPSSPFYTLQGWQTSAPRKGGIYIGNGRKVVSK